MCQVATESSVSYISGRGQAARALNIPGTYPIQLLDNNDSYTFSCDLPVHYSSETDLYDTAVEWLKLKCTVLCLLASYGAVVPAARRRRGARVTRGIRNNACLVLCGADRCCQTRRSLGLQDKMAYSDCCIFDRVHSAVLKK